MKDTFGIIDQMSDAEQAEYDALDKTPTPEALSKQFRTPATVGWVKRYVATHMQWCPAIRLLRRLGVVACLLLAGVIVLNVLNLRQGAMNREALRTLIHDAMIAQGLIHAQEAPAGKVHVAQEAP